MASTLMHLAIAKRIESKKHIVDKSRYRIGQILPDVNASSSNNHNDSHYKVTICDGMKKMFDFSEFYHTCKEKILSDDIYLGYYLHLVQDAFYRKFLYIDSGYQVTSKKDVEVLHNDYRILNSYLVSNYEIGDNLRTPESLPEELISEKNRPDLQEFLQEIAIQRTIKQEGKLFFFTETMADEYIAKATELCCKEFDAIMLGHSCLNPIDYAWELVRK